MVFKRENNRLAAFEQQQKARLIRRLALAAAGIVAASVASVFFIDAVQPVRNPVPLDATVTSALNYTNTSTGQSHLEIQAKLPDGALVRVSAPWQLPPKIGARIRIDQYATWLGGRAYRWEGETISTP